MTSLAQLIRERRDSIARRWIERVRAHLPTGRPLDEAEIIDSLQAFLEEVVAALEAGTPLPETGTAVAQAHGAQRQILDRDIADVVRGYGLLFESIMEESRATGAGPFEPEEYARLGGCLSRGAAEAVREFAGLRALELRRQAWEHFAFLAHEIFEAFRQSNEDRSGFGLGLAIARQGLDAHGGSLTVRNLPGKGCVFAVVFPERR